MDLNLNPRTLPEAREELGKADTEIKRLDGELTAAKKAPPAENPEVARLTGDLEEANKARTAAEGRATTAEGKLEEANKQVEAKSQEITKLQESQKTLEASVEEKAKNKAIEILGSKGLSPLKLGLVDAQGEKKDRSKMKGTEKVTAAFTEELSQQK